MHRLKNDENKEKHQNESNKEFQRLKSERISWKLGERWEAFKGTTLAVTDNTFVRRKFNGHLKITKL